MKKTHFSKLFICFLILISISCEESKLTELPSNSVDSKIMTEDLTVQSAQIWFETKIKKNNNARIESTKEPLWEYAVESKQNDGTTVISAPLLIDEKKQSFGLVFQEADAAKQKKQFENKNIQTKGLSTPEKLVMIKDSKGEISTFNVKIIADYDYFEKSLEKEKKSIAKNDGNDFDGLLFFNEWDTPQNLGGLRIVKGKFSSDKSNSKSRLSTNCSTYTVTLYATCDQFKVLENGCSINQNYTVCDGGVYSGSPGGEGTTTFFNFATVISGGGPAPIDILSSSYRQNQVNIFANAAAQYGVIFNPDEKLEFKDNFENFLKIKDDLMSAVKKWGTGVVSTIEQKYNQITYKSIKQEEKNILTYSGYFGYRVNLLIYLWNAFQAENMAEGIMNSIGRSGSTGKSCNLCRGNAVKHAGWVIRNANTFGSEMGQSLANAHESGEPTNNETFMDVYNNFIGMSLYNSYGVADALSLLKDVLVGGMPSNSADGLRFIKIENGVKNLYWTKDYPNED